MTLGSASNADSTLHPEMHAVAVDNDLDLVVFIHQQDVTIWGGGSSANGQLRYDVSIDGGATFSNDIGILNPVNTHPARHPNVAIFNPAASDNPLDTRLLWVAPVLDSTPTFDGFTHGVSSLTTAGTPTSSEYYAFQTATPTTFNPGSLTPGEAGDYWMADFDHPSRGDGTVVLYRGTYDGKADFDWAVGHSYTPDYYLDAIVRYSPTIAFSPDGTTGYAFLLGDLSGIAADGQLAPVFVATTDGGDTWSAPHEISLATEAVVTLLASFDDEASGVPTTTYEADLTVDAEGRFHLLVALSNQGESGPDPSFGQLLVDVVGTVDGESIVPLAEITAFEGAFGPNDDDRLIQHNRPQIARDDAGEHVFFAWVDTDPSFGLGADNLAPNLHTAGLRIADFAFAGPYDITQGDLIWEGRVLHPTMAPTVLGDGDSFELPIVVMELVQNDEDLPVYHYYFGNDAVIAAADFEVASAEEDSGDEPAGDVGDEPGDEPDDVGIDSGDAEADAGDAGDAESDAGDPSDVGDEVVEGDASDDAPVDAPAEVGDDAAASDSGDGGDGADDPGAGDVQADATDPAVDGAPPGDGGADLGSGDADEPSEDDGCSCSSVPQAGWANVLLIAAVLLGTSRRIARRG